ncbi:NlpC/P60 family protein, partial [Klebsiella pneumoniae]|uniref:NlpC/P60 family protein n=1 Tax=Klebsiella pneumoniae TaxID=573 RepID=UPI003AF981DD
TYGDWTAIIYNGTPGYVYAQYVKEGSYSNTVSPGVSGSVEGKQIADFALQFVGYNYCWGGKSPDTGFDCSGLVYYTYAQFGYTLN